MGASRITHLSVVLAGLACALPGLPAAAQTPGQDRFSPEAVAKADAESYAKAERDAEAGRPESFHVLFDRYLFRAGDKTDLGAAKRLADLAREKRVKLGYSQMDMLATVDACYAAGKPDLPPGDTRPDKLDNNRLAERYANGEGVARNPRLAIALVCHGSRVPAELWHMVESLTATKDQAKLAKPFRWCDHVMSGDNTAICSAEMEEKAVAERRAAFATLTASWTPEQKSAFEALQAAGEEFWKLHAYAEQDMHGSGHRSFYMMELATTRAALLANLRDLEAGKLPQQDDYLSADKELNKAYARVIANYENAFKTAGDDFLRRPTANTEELRKTERAWIVYRDAWAAFGAKRYPQVAEGDWLAWITRKRIEQLNKAPDWKW